MESYRVNGENLFEKSDFFYLAEFYEAENISAKFVKET
jgi:hypothetical protein